MQAGGPEDQRLHNRMIRFPKTDAEGKTIRIEGEKPVVDKICAAIEALVVDQDSQTTEVNTLMTAITRIQTDIPRLLRSSPRSTACSLVVAVR